MKPALLAVVPIALLAACHPPSLRDRAKTTGARFGDLGVKIVAVVKPITPSTAQLTAIATDQATAQLASAGAQQGALSFHKNVDLSGGDSPAPAAQGGDSVPPVANGGGDSPAPMPVVTRTQAPSTIFALRARTRDGRNSCTVYKSKDECVSSCTNMLRLDSMKTDRGALQSCSCLEEDPGRCP